MGLGKTVSAIAAAKQVTDRVLVVTPKTQIPHWERHLQQWAPELQATVLNYEKLLNERLLLDLLKQQPPVIILDEVHRVRHRKTKIHKAVKRLTRHAEFCWGLSGTPLVRSPTDLLGIYIALNPATKGGYWGLVNTFMLTQKGVWGNIEILGVANPEYFKQWLRTWALRRTKPSEGWPTKQRVGIPLRMDDPQLRQWHDELWEEFMTELDDEVVLTPTKLAALTRIRQLLVSPKLLNPKVLTAGPKAQWIQDFLESHPTTPVVIFSPFKEALYHFGVDHIISGDTPQKRRQEVIQKFQGGDVNVVGVSLTMAEGFELPRGQVGVFVGFDWNASTMRQAEDRLHRPTNPNDRVIYYYLYFEDSPVERHVLDVVNAKLTWQQVFVDELNTSHKN